LATSTPFLRNRFNGAELTIDVAVVQASVSSRDIDVIYDCNAGMSDHTKTACRSSYVQLESLSYIKGSLTHESLNKVTDA